ncbi:uncharacterized protein DUF3396 [Defluviimonas denitrificans]|uniref:Uncharacterized protein DUF3396 n=2 Tax=Albidovulum denitrificans TaxID=404881 RepID=A0A2S8S6P3_9RHOB|nr:uncharacterized protein DUF3396 [Defluviimonas denitrificans]
MSDHQLKNIGRPAFRLSLQSSVFSGHPLHHVEEWRRLFGVFEPILRRDAERLLFLTNGLRPRRRKSIKSEDWDPFGHLRAEVADEGFTFIGFDFQSGFNGGDRYDIGPTKFFMDIASNLFLTATVPVQDFENGTLDIAAMKAAILGIPVFSGLAGYGMCLTDTLDWPHPSEEAVYPVACKYPVLDLCKDYNRTWSSSQVRNNDIVKNFWAVGINWLTLIQEPLLAAMGGKAALTDGLDSAITWEEGPYGLLFQLGDRPITGEAGVDDALLPLYFEMGQRMRPASGEIPAALKRHTVFSTSPGDRAEDNLRWVQRFYDREWFEKPCKEINE